ncbi:hypothetical protein TNCV_4318221 [Trichonephila clavipes]|nr:hypothetical protein TNCV_4318221 [Trichonephila clavipes]
MRLVRRAIGYDFIFIDDNAKLYRVVKYFLKVEGVCQLEWTQKSPDLSPIKRVWDSLGRAISRRQYSFKYTPDIQICAV